MLDTASPEASGHTDDAISEDDGVYGFSWVIDGALAGMPVPSEDDLAWVAGQGVGLVITLTESPLDPTLLADLGLEGLHLPVEDLTPPTITQANRAVAAITAHLDAGQAVAIHCTAGLGRTGTMLAMWFVHSGMRAEQAISHVRALRPGSIETTEQELAIGRYAARQHGGP